MFTQKKFKVSMSCLHWVIKIYQKHKYFDSLRNEVELALLLALYIKYEYIFLKSMSFTMWDLNWKVWQFNKRIIRYSSILRYVVV